jgi:hypothetical protein
MKYLLSVTALLAASVSVSAKDKITPLTADAAAQIQNKTFIVTRHAKPDFTAMTAGKASFALLGAIAMVKEGNEIVQENHIPDNAEILESVLVPVLIKKYAMKLVDENANHTALVKPEEIAKEQTQGDYILDIASLNWMSLYYPGNWSEYHTFYMGQARLIERATGKQLSSMTCVINGRKEKNKFPPSKDDMLADQAQLLKDMLASQGWSCAQHMAKDEFGIADADIPKTPEKYVDPQADFAAKKALTVTPAIVPTK